MSDPLPPDLSADLPGDHEFEPRPKMGETSSPFFPCLKCGQRRPLERCYRICAFCMADCQRDPAKAKMWLYGPREQPEPCLAPPGSEEKLALLRKRIEEGEECFGGEDPPLDPCPAKLAVMLHRPLMREAGLTGIERDGDSWRCRPMHRGVKHDLGTFPLEQEKEAVETVWAFWLTVLGLPENPTQEQIEEARARAANESKELAQQKMAQARRNRRTSMFG